SRGPGGLQSRRPMAFDPREWLPSVDGWFLAATRAANPRGRLARQRLLARWQGAGAGDGLRSGAAGRAEPGHRIRSTGRPKPGTCQLDPVQPRWRTFGD